MIEPQCAQKAPYQMELDPGVFWWCACGRSRNQPFCDGSHKDTGFAPVKFELKERTTIWLCGCKRTHRAPHCDGTHKSL